MPKQSLRLHEMQVVVIGLYSNSGSMPGSPVGCKWRMEVCMAHALTSQAAKALRTMALATAGAAEPIQASAYAVSSQQASARAATAAQPGLKPASSALTTAVSQKAHSRVDGLKQQQQKLKQHPRQATLQAAHGSSNGRVSTASLALHRLDGSCVGMPTKSGAASARASGAARHVAASLTGERNITCCGSNITCCGSNSNIERLAPSSGSISKDSVSSSCSSRSSVATPVDPNSPGTITCTKSSSSRHSSTSRGPGGAGTAPAPGTGQAHVPVTPAPGRGHMLGQLVQGVVLQVQVAGALLALPGSGAGTGWLPVSEISHVAVEDARLGLQTGDVVQVSVC